MHIDQNYGGLTVNRDEKVDAKNCKALPDVVGCILEFKLHDRGIDFYNYDTG